jgi:hypothetical protein
MPLATKCLVIVNVKKALEIRDEGGVIHDSPTMFKCIECGRTVRPRAKGKAKKNEKGQKAHFAHLKRNPNCSLSDHLD